MATLSVSTGHWLRELREARGLMPTDMPVAMRRAGIPPLNVPSPRSIWRAETGNVVPRLRHRYGLAKFFGVPLASLWPEEERCRRG